MRSSGLPVFFAYIISDEINALIGEVFSRRLEKITSIFSSIASIAIGMPVDARIIYTPSVLSAIEYLIRRQELGRRNAILKEAYEESLKRLKDRRRAQESIEGKPLDVLSKEYSYRIPKRALLGSMIIDEPQEAYEFSSEKGRRRLYKELMSLKLERLESRIRSVERLCSPRLRTSSPCL